MLNVSFQPSAGRDDRADVRTRLLINATCDARTDKLTGLSVRDLSTTGVLFETDDDLQPPSLIKLHLPVVGICDARLVWSDGRYRGAKFVVPLTQSSVQAVYDRSKVVWPTFSPMQVAGIKDRSAIEAPPVLGEIETDVDLANSLPPGLKILFVVLLAILLWLGLAFGALVWAA